MSLVSLSLGESGIATCQLVLESKVQVDIDRNNCGRVFALVTPVLVFPSYFCQYSSVVFGFAPSNYRRRKREKNVNALSFIAQHSFCFLVTN